MKQYDFRFEISLIESFIGKALMNYKHAEFMFENAVTGILGFEIDDVVYELTNEFEAMDFLSLDSEATVFRISKSNWNDLDSRINNTIIEISVGEMIKKIILVNDHTILKLDENVANDMWDTKAIIFCFENHEIGFVKEDCWFSQEIEIYKGQNLLEKAGNGEGIFEDFYKDDIKKVFVERNIVEVK